MKGKKHLISPPILFEGEKRIGIVFLLAIMVITAAFAYASMSDNTEAKTNPDSGVDTDTNINTNINTDVATNTETSVNTNANQGSRVEAIPIEDVKLLSGTWEPVKKCVDKEYIEFKTNGQYVWVRSKKGYPAATETGTWTTRSIDRYVQEGSSEPPQKIGETKFVLLGNRLLKIPGYKPAIQPERAEFQVKDGYITGPEVNSEDRWIKIK